MGERINECGRQTAEWTMDGGAGKAFEAVREGQTVNQWGNESTNADGGQQMADGVGQAFQPVRGEGEPSTNGETNKRMRTADGRGRRTGFRGCQREDGEPSTNGERINECGPRTA
jgi:hypothetical protein